MVGEGGVAQPVHLGDRNTAGRQRLARADHDLSAVRVEPDDIERIAATYAEPAALADRVVDDTPMGAEDIAVHINNFTRFSRKPTSAAESPIASPTRAAPPRF